MTTAIAKYDVRARDVPRALFPRGRVRFSLGTRTADEARRRHAVMERLRQGQHWEVLRALQEEIITAAEVVRRVERSGLNSVPEILRDVQVARAGRIPTFKEEGQRYLEWYARKRGTKSHQDVESRLRRLGRQPAYGHPEGTTLDGLPVTAIARDVLDRAIAASSPSRKTRESLLAAASGLYTWSVREEADRARIEARAPRWTANPAKGIELGGDTTTTRKATATPGQVAALLVGAQLYQIAYLRAFVHLGLRVDELIHTRLDDDLDLRTWLWSIQPRGADPRCPCPHCSVRRGRGGRGWRPKTKRGVRTFEVPADPAPLREAIATYLEAQPGAPGDFVFRNPRTARVWSYSGISGDFATLCTAVGVRYGRVPGGLTLHTFRHTCITNLVRAGVQESLIAGLVGDTLDAIAKNYVHPNAKDFGDAIRRGPAYV